MYKTDDRFMKISDNSSNQISEKNKKQSLALLDWLKRSIEYEHFLAANTLRYKIIQGEVYEIDFGRNVGSELNERHYAVVIHNSQEDAQNIVVVPLTTKVHYSYGGVIDLGILEGINTKDHSFARVSQIRTVDKARIYLKPIMNNNENRRISGPVTKLSKEQFNLVISGLNTLLNTK